MSLVDMLSNGPLLTSKVDRRRSARPEQKVDDVMGCLPGTSEEISDRSGWNITTVRRIMKDAVSKGLVEKVYVGGSKGGKRYRYELVR